MTPAQRRRLAALLTTMQPGQRFRFWLSPTAPEWLCLCPLTPESQTEFSELLVRVAGQTGVVGLMVVDALDRCVFCAPKAPQTLLATLVAGVSEHQASMQSTCRLIGSLAVEVRLEIGKPSRLREVRLRDLAPAGGAVSWDDQLLYETQDVAEHLDDLFPGERFGFWIREDRSASPPILLQAAHRDPMSSRLNQLIDAAWVGRGESTAQGTGQVAGDGLLQLIGQGFQPAMLATVADWVHRHVADCPGLARLKDLELVELDGTRVADVIRRPGVWADCPDPVIPGSLHETAQVLEQLEPGETASFWMTLRGQGRRPTLCLQLQRHGSFLRRLTWLGRRYPAARDAVHGTVRRQTSGALVFLTPFSKAGSLWDSTLRFLVTLADEHPPLRELTRARLAITHRGAVVQAARAPNERLRSAP